MASFYQFANTRKTGKKQKRKMLEKKENKTKRKKEKRAHGVALYA